MEKSAKERLEEAEKIVDENYNLEAEEEKIKEIPETDLSEVPDEAEGVSIVKFKPTKYTDKKKNTVTISELVLDASKITGRVISNSEKQFLYNGYTLANSLLFQSTFFQLIVASKISGVELDFILDELPCGVITEIGMAVQGFLQTWGSVQ